MCKKIKKNCLIQADRKINPNAKLNIKIIKKEKEKKSGGFYGGGFARKLSHY